MLASRSFSAIRQGRKFLSTAVAGAKDAAAFESFMSNRQGSVLTEDLDGYNQDWSVSFVLVYLVTGKYPAVTYSVRCLVLLLT
jgi:hypothetical protein